MSTKYLHQTSSWVWTATNLDGTNWSASNYANTGSWYGPHQGCIYNETTLNDGVFYTTATTGSKAYSQADITYYFLTDVDLSDWETPPASSSFYVAHVIDDGLVIHVNGTSSYKYLMTADNPAYADYATATVGEAVLSTPVIIPSTAFKQGINRIACEVHQSNNASSDMLFGLELYANDSLVVERQLLEQTSSWKWYTANLDGVGWTGSNYSDTGSWYGPHPAAIYEENVRSGTWIWSTPIAGSKTYLRADNSYQFITDVDLSDVTTPTSGTFTAELLIDDACLIFVNGVPAYSHFLPVGATYATDALRTAGDAAKEGPYTISSSAFVQGINRIAVQVNQKTTNSSDLAFGMTLKMVISDEYLESEAVNYSQSVSDTFSVSDNVSFEHTVGSVQYSQSVADTFSVTDNVAFEHTGGLNAGLTAHWNFDESSGIRYSQDSQSNFIYNQDVASINGKFGQSPKFAKATGSVLIAPHDDNIGIAAGESFTIGFWAYIVDTGFVQDFIIKGGDVSWDAKRSYGIYTNGGNWNFTIGNNTTAATITRPIVYGEWQYLLFGYDATANIFYAQKNNDTLSSASFDQGTYTNTGSLRLGGANSSGSAYLASGSVDNMSIWKRVLTATERSWLYNSGNGLEIDDYDTGPVVEPAVGLLNNLSAHWNLDETSGIRYSHDSQSNFIYNQSFTGSEAGVYGNAAKFPALDLHALSCPDNSNISIGVSQSFSIGLWIKQGGTGVQNIFIKGINDGTATYREYWLTRQPDDKWYWQIYNGAGGSTNFSYPVTASQWVYHLLEYDHSAGSASFYVNNVQVATTQSFGSWNNNTGSLTISGRPVSGSTGFFFTGSMDNISIWKRTLTSQEKDWLWNSGSGLSFEEYEYGPQGEAVSYTSSIEDSTSYIDVVSTVAEYTRSWDDTFSSTDQVSTVAQYTRSVADTFTPADQVSLVATFTRSVSDTFSSTDQVSWIGAFTRSVSDSVLFTDSVAFVLTEGDNQYSASVSDTFTPSDNVSWVSNLSRSVSDAFTTSDSVSLVANYSRSVSDSFSTTDQVSLVSQITRSVQDTFTTTDQVSTATQYSRSVEDTFTATDSVVSIVSIFQDIADVFSVSDQVSIVATYTSSVADAVNFNDAVATVGTFVRSVVDTFSPTDQVATLTQYSRSVADSITFTDSVDAQISIGSTAYSQSVQDSFSVSDSVEGVVLYVMAVSDTFTLTDDTTHESILTSQVSDTFSVTDQTTRQSSFSVFVSDSVSIDDAVSKIATYVRSVSDSFTATDNISTATDYSRNVSDTFILSDESIGAITKVISIEDFFTMLDEATATYTAGLPIRYFLHIQNPTYSVSNPNTAKGKSTVNEVTMTGIVNRSTNNTNTSIEGKNTKSSI